MNKISVYEWINNFKKERDGVEDDEQIGRQSASICEEKIDVVRDLIEGDWRLTAEIIAGTRDISVGSDHTILSEKLKLSNLSVRWVSDLLSPKHGNREKQNWH